MNDVSANGAYDVSRIRADFPILAMQVYGKPLVYLDNAASAQKPKAVLDRLQQAYTTQYANVHRGLHYLANEATEAYEGAREKVAAFLNAGRKEEIIFTRNATEAINLVAYTFGRERIQPGDEIVLSIMEHHSTIVPWHFLRERQGAVIKWAPVDDEGHFLVDEFEKLWTPRTKMVAITHMSNVLGTLVPVKEVTRLSRARRRRAGGGAPRYRRAGHRLRFLCFYRPQALRPDRNWRAVRQICPPRRHAAVQRRRRDDPRSVRGPRHLRRTALQIRGRHAGHRAGDRTRRGDRLRGRGRQAAHPRPRAGAGALRPRPAARDQFAAH